MSRKNSSFNMRGSSIENFDFLGSSENTNQIYERDDSQEYNSESSIETEEILKTTAKSPTIDLQHIHKTITKYVYIIFLFL